MVLFAFLGNTLFLTILVSMLSNTFSIISANATAEVQFRRAVLTFEGVKSDAIFAYMPPFNILALVILLPLKFVVSDRTFHKMNVFATRTLNAPILLLLGLYERRNLWHSDRHHHHPPAPKSIDWKRRGGPVAEAGWWAHTINFWNFSRFSVHGDLHAVFETDPPQSVLDEIAEEDDLHGGDGPGKALNAALEDQFPSAPSPRHLSPKGGVNQRKSGTKTKPLSKPPKGRRRSSQSSNQDQLLKEFGSPSDESELARSHGYKGGNKKKPRRMDSVVDFGPDGSAMDEANDRLHKLEGSISRIEEMLTKFVDAENDDGDSGDDDVAPELNQEIQTGIRE